jgi:hypothetical protein
MTPFRNIIFFILIIFIASCQTENTLHESEDKMELEYIFVGRTRHSIDTVFKSIIEKEFADSIYRLTYRNFNKNDTFNQSFEFPISKSLTTYHHLHDTSDYRLVFLDNKLIRYDSKDYTVFKYLYDDKNSDDEEMLYFFVPQFGIVITKSAWWGNYDRLIGNGNNADKDDLFFINEMIIFDSDFFHKH